MINIEEDKKNCLNSLIRAKRYGRLDQKKLSRLIKHIIRRHEYVNGSAISISYSAEHTLANATASRLFESHFTKKELRKKLWELTNGGEDFERKLIEFIKINNSNNQPLTINAKTIKHARRCHMSCQIKPWC
ncbi:hypothetical protein ACQZMW_002330 [Vibrio fluvialis]